jgi:hypothetical protein
VVMRRFFIVLIAIGLLVTGCKKKDNPASQSDPGVTPAITSSVTGIANSPVQELDTAPSIEIKEEIIRKMRDMVLSDKTPYELIEFIQNSINGTQADEADKLFLILETVQKAWLGYFQGSMDFSPENTDDEFLAWFNNNGFKLITIDSDRVPAISYDVYWNNRNSLSEWYAHYIEIIRSESNEPSVWNGKLNIPVEELENRILKTSDYMEKYPETIKTNEVMNYYEDYLFAYLYGYDPDPVCDVNEGLISRKHYERYKEFVKNHAGSTVSGILSEYIGLIEKGNFSLTDEIMFFLEDVFSGLNEQKSADASNIGVQIMAERMVKLLPGKTGFFWRCFGFAEYGHNAVLSSIRLVDGNPVYIVTGEVDDLSGGETQGDDFSIYLQYTIENNILVQSKDAPLMMDSDFNGIELIRYPFITGHKWIQYPVDDKGNKYSIETEIINIYESDDGTIYEVEYRDMSNGKVENRLIQSGKGTIGFTKIYDDNENEPFYIGYTIYEEQTGYLDN